MKFVFFLESKLLFNILYCSCMFVHKHFDVLNVKHSEYHFYIYVKAKRKDFDICVSAPSALVHRKRMHFLTR